MQKSTPPFFRIQRLFHFFMVLYLLVLSLSATEMQLVVNDSAGVGFQDATVVTPVGGNTGTTLGQQRRIALQFAADIWASRLQSTVPIEILTRFESLGCTGTPVLARGNPTSMISDFANAPLTGMLYPIALANSLARTDLRPTIVPTDITLIFNLDIEGSCLDPADFYYGLDGEPGSDIDFVTVALRELAHGLGFYTPMNGATGAYSSGKPDIFIRNLFDETQNKRWTEMTSDAQRAASAINTGNLVWAGTNVTAAAGSLSGGVNSSGKVQIHAPNPYQSGVSLFHFSSALAPVQLLSPPTPTLVDHEPGLALQLLTDLGWARLPFADLSLSVTASNESPSVEEAIEILLTLRNNGPDPASSIRVQVLRPSGLDYLTHKGDGAYANATGFWDLGSLAAGSSAVLQLQAMVSSSGLLVFSAEVLSAAEPDPDSDHGNGNQAEDDYTRISLSSTERIGANDILDGIQVPSGEWRFFRTVADPNLVYLGFESYGGTGNADLFVRHGSLPTLEEFHYHSQRADNQERILLGPGGITSGDWFIGLFGRDSARGLRLATSASSNNLGVTIESIDPSLCPVITAEIRVIDPAGPVTGLTQQKFSLRQLGLSVGALSGFQELEPGLYQMSYSTSLFGPGTMLSATVTANGMSAANERMYDGCNEGGPEVQVWLKPDETISAGQRRVIPMIIQPISEAIGVASFEIRVFYDPNLLTFHQVEKSCTLIWNWDLVFSNQPNPGEIRISAANSDGFVLSSYQDDVLLGLDFTANANAQLETCADLTFDPDAFVFNNNTPTAALSDGRICVTSAPSNLLSSDLELVLAISNSQPNVGEKVLLDYTLTNLGPQTVNSATVSVPLPSGLRFNRVVQGSGFNHTTQIWSVSCLRENSYRTVIIEAVITSDQDQVVVCEVKTSDQTDPDSTPNNGVTSEDDYAVNYFYPLSSDLELTKTAHFSELYKDSIGEFRVRVTNKGPDFVNFFEVFDELPAGLELLETLGPGQYDSETFTWRVEESLLQDEFVDLIFRVRLASKGLKTNIAYIDRSVRFDPDSTPGNELAQEDDYDTAEVTPLTTDLRLAQTIDRSTPKVGENIAVTLTVSNDGPLAESGVEVTEKLPRLTPPGLSFVSASTAGFNSATGIWSVGALSVGQSKSIVLTYRVDSIPAKTLTAEISNARHFDLDSQPGNGAIGEDDLASVTLTPQYADLSLSTTAVAGEVGLGQTLDLAFTLTNGGTHTVSASSLFVSPGSGFQFVQFTGTGSFSAKTGIWNTGSLAAGASVQGSFRYTVNQISGLSFLAELESSDQADPDSVPSNRVGAEDDIVSLLYRVPVADLRLAKTVDNRSPAVGQTIRYSLTLINDGPSSAQSVTVRDQLPSGLSFQAFAGTGSYDSGTGLWSLGSVVTAGAAVSCTIDARVDSGSLITNTAEVAGSSAHDPDSTPGNAVAGEDDMASVKIGRADLELAMSVDNSEPPVGSSVTFTLSVVNRGPAAATGVLVRDKLPVGLTFSSASGGSYDASTGIWNIGSLALNQSASLSLIARVFGAAQKTNTAEIVESDLGDPDSTPGNGLVGEDDLASVSLVGQCGNGGGQILVNNQDGPGEGFNDGRIVAQVGGNTGTTVGQQRLIAFRYAAEIWEQILTPNVDMTINAKFDPLECSAGGGILGMAGPNAVARDFDGAAFPETFYHMAIANNLVGSDLNGSVAEITALFNSAIDSNNNCLANVNWYYGLDGRPLGNDIDFVTVLLHELAHGLGFSSLADGNSGQKFMGFNDIYMQFLEDHSTGKLWPQMSNSERAASARDNGDLHWTGLAVTAALGTLTAGTANGHARMYAPSSFKTGSSVSHWDTVMTPNQLMEPSYTQVLHDPGLAAKLLEDLGWGCQPEQVALADLSLRVIPSHLSPDVGQTISFQILVPNAGSSPATGVSIESPFPPGVQFVSASGHGSYNPADGIWTIGTIPFNEQRVITLTGTVDGSTAFTFIAEVKTQDQVDPDSTPGNGVAEEDDFDFAAVQPIVPKRADLSATLFLDRQFPNEGELVSLYFSIHNAGPDPATGVTAKLPANSELAFESSSAGANYNSSTRIWTPGGLLVGESKRIRLDVRVNAQAPLDLLAQVWTSHLADPDSTPGNGPSGQDDEAIAHIFPQSGVCPPAARIEVLNLDGPEEGFNDPTPMTPVGGNPGVTLGEQRYFAFLRAADELSSYLSSGQLIQVGAKFDSLACSETGAILGTSGPASAARDFAGAPFAATWYPVALANARSNSDLNGQTPEITAVFNSDIDLDDLQGKTLTEPEHSHDKTTPDPGVCTCANPADPQECESQNIHYVVERKNTSFIKFEDAPEGLGEDFKHETDRFVIKVNTSSTVVQVKVKASTSTSTVVLTGVGDTKVTSIGFCAKLESISQDGYFTIALTSECNRHALSHVEFTFSGGVIVSPSNSYTAVRTTLCEGDGGGDEEPPPPNTCLNGLQWYYGFDAQPGNFIDLITVVKHELLHGLGFTTYVDLAGSNGAAAGSKLDGYDDAFMRYLQDGSTGLRWSEMTDSQRAASAKDSDDLLWAGSYVTQAAGAAAGGTGAQGLARLFAPNPLVPGLSVIHWSTGFSPDQLMEPSYSGPIHNPGLAIPLLYDLGWPSPACTDLSLEKTVDNETPNAGEIVTFTLAVTNHGPENGTGISVTDQLPDGFEFVSDNGGGSYDAPSGVWQIGELSSGSSAELEIQARVLVGGEKTNVAEIRSADQRDPDSEPGNGAVYEDDWDSVGTGSADLSLSLDINQGQVLIGEVVTFTISVTNAGPDRPNTVAVGFEFPENIIYLGDNGNGSYIPILGEWHLGGIDVGETRTLQLSARAAAVGSYDFGAEITLSVLRDGDSTPGNGSTNEDDDDDASLSVSYPTHELAVLTDAVCPTACPELSVRAFVTLDGQPLSALQTGDFTLREDGVVVSFTLAEDPDFPGTYLLTYSSSRADGLTHQADVAVEYQGNRAFGGTPFNTCAASGCRDLTNHIPVPYVSGFRGSLRCFRIEVPPLQRQLKFRIYGGQGDGDLLIRRGAEPSLSEWDYRPNTPGNVETVVINYPQSGTWYADIHGFREYTQVTIVADYYPSLYEFEVLGVYPSACPDIQVKVRIERDGSGVLGLNDSNFSLSEDGNLKNFSIQALSEPGEYALFYTTNQPDGAAHSVEVTCNAFGETFTDSNVYENCAIGCSALTNNKVIPNVGGLAGYFRCFYIDVPAGMDGLEFMAWDGVGDSDMYIRFGQEPSLDNYDFLPLGGGNGEAQLIEAPTPGRWYMSLYAFQDFTGVKVRARYYRNDLSLKITKITLTECPLITVDSTVTFGGSGLAGLREQDFLLQENGELITAESFTDLGSGKYRATYFTQQIEFGGASINCAVTTANRSAVDQEYFAYCNARGPFVNLWVNNAHAAPPDTDIVIPIWVGPVNPEFGVNSIELRLTYDASVLEYRGLTTVGSLLSSWPSVLDTESVQGDIRISAASLDERRVLSAVAEENRLVLLRFHVRPTVVEDTCIQLNLVEADILLNDGLPYFFASDGSFCALQCPGARGDVDGDGNNREAYDARMILLHVLDEPTPYDPIPLCVADTNCSGSVSLTDVVKVLQYSVRYIEGYCLESQGGIRGTGDFQISLTPESLAPEAGEAFQIGIDISTADPFFGYGFRLEYDPAVLSLTGAVNDIGTLSERYDAPTVVNETGAVSIYGFYPSTPLQGEGRLINLEAFALQPGQTQISFTRFELANEAEAQTTFGPYTITVGGELCYSQQQYETLLTGWPTANVLQMVQLLNCQ